MTALVDHRLQAFRLRRLLGSGGMGSVYLAEAERSWKDVPKGATVAVKVLHAHLAHRTELVRRFRREAELGRTVRHPRVMRIHGPGRATVEGEDVHFIVMEYLGGPTLRRLLEQNGPLADEEVARIGAEIAEGLAALHERGMVHRDIKPHNIFLDDEGHVKIGDLGLSRLIAPSTEISIEGTVVGSAAYAPPEQLEGKRVGPDADLYALGVTLFELATGRNPFLGRDVEATIHAQRVKTAPPLLEWAPDKSWFLDRFLAALLDKDPDHRPSPAGLVARTLARRERSEWWRDYVRGRGKAGARIGARLQLRVLRWTRLWGFESERDRIADALRTAIVGRTGSVSIVEGEAGGGRSRLVDAALEALGSDLARAELVVGRFLDLAAPEPYYALNKALLRALGLDRLERGARRKALVEALRLHLPERSPLAEAFAALVDGKEEEGALGALDPDSVAGLYSEAFRTLSARRPLVVVLEELQWADAGSLRVLEAMSSWIASHPLAVVATTHPPSTGPGAGAVEPSFLERIVRAGPGAYVRLERLDRAAIRGIARDLGVPEALRDRFAQRLHAASEGNPAILFAVVEDLQDRKPLPDLRAHDLVKLPLPRSATELLRRRLENLSPEERRFVEFASVFGVRFKLEQVAAGLGLSDERATEIARGLADRHRIVRPFEQAYRFDHHLLREQVYRSAPPEQRRRDHCAVARMLASEVGDPHRPARAAYEAAVHFVLAEAWAEALPYLVGGIRYLQTRSQFERAARLAEHAERAWSAAEASSAPTDREVGYELWSTLAAIYGHLGRSAEESRALGRALRLAERLGDAARIAEAEVALARAAAREGRTLEALGHADHAERHGRQAGRFDLVAAALRAQAAVLETLGETDHGKMLEEADRLAQEAGDEVGRAHGLLLLAKLQIATDRLEDALQTLREARSLFARLGDERGRGRTLFHVARVFRELGDLRRALRALDLARRVAEQNLDRRLAARVDYLAGDLAMRRRRFEEAETSLRRAVGNLEEVGDQPFRVYALAALALTRAARGNPRRDVEAALRAARQARSLAAELRIARLEAYAYAVLAFVHLAADRPAFALAVVRKALRFLRDRPVGRKREAEIRFLHYRCLRRVGRDREAREELRRARELVLERARAIRKPAYRHAFLRYDPFHVAVLRKAERELGPA